MTTQELETALESFIPKIDGLENLYADDWNSESAAIIARVSDEAEKRSVAFAIKRIFRECFGYKGIEVRFDYDFNGYLLDFPYAYYEVKEDCND